MSARRLRWMGVARSLSGMGWTFSACSMGLSIAREHMAGFIRKNDFRVVDQSPGNGVHEWLSERIGREQATAAGANLSVPEARLFASHISAACDYLDADKQRRDAADRPKEGE